PPIDAAWLPLSTPRPPASTPRSRTSLSPRNALNIPIAFEPPPTQATTTLGSMPTRSSHCARASRPMIDWNSRTIVGYGCGPVADRFIHRVLQRAATRFDGAHLRTEKAHAKHVGRLPVHVLGAHVHDALEPEERARRRACHAVLTRAGLRDDALLPHPPRKECLPERAVDLVRAGVGQILALEHHAPQSDQFREAR